MRRLPRSSRLALSLACLLAACGGTRRSSLRTAEEAWIEPSPQLEQEIQDQAASIPYQQKMEDLVAVISWFADVGEPAYPTLLELAQADDAKVAGVALAAMGETRDSRLVPHLERLSWPDRRKQPKLFFERARTHVKLGDWEPMDVLLDGLEDEDVYTRLLCFRALREETRETFDYEPRGAAEERAAAVARWRAWLAERRADRMLER